MPLKVPVNAAALIVGEVNVGDVPNTNNPLPVSSLITPANSDEDVAVKALSLLVV